MERDEGEHAEKKKIMSERVEERGRERTSGLDYYCSPVVGWRIYLYDLLGCPCSGILCLCSLPPPHIVFIMCDFEIAAAAELSRLDIYNNPPHHRCTTPTTTSWTPPTHTRHPHPTPPCTYKPARQ